MLKRGGVAGTIPVLAQRAASEGPRWTRAVGIIPATHYKGIVAAALLDGLVEHPARCSPVFQDMRASEGLACLHSFSEAC